MNYHNIKHDDMNNGDGIDAEQKGQPKFNFVPRFRGFRTWAVYEWIDKFQIRRKSK